VAAPTAHPPNSPPAAVGKRWNGSRMRRLLLAFAVVGYVATGLYSVQNDESAVAFVLGRAVDRDVLPGMHWNLPWPIGKVIVAKTATNFTMPVGYRFLPRPGEPAVSDLWLTGDTNIVTARLNVQYSIRSLADFLLDHESPRELVRRAGERALTRRLITEDVDAVLTTRRQHVLESVHQRVQELLDSEGAGIDIQSITVQELAPPAEGGVRAAFQEVQDASADRERVIYEAGAYRAQVIAEAEGEAQRLRSDGLAAERSRVELARGRTARFAALAAEHDRAPEVTEQRLYLESIDRILPNVQTYVVEPGKGGNVNLRIVK